LKTTTLHSEFTFCNLCQDSGVAPPSSLEVDGLLVPTPPRHARPHPRCGLFSMVYSRNSLAARCQSRSSSPGVKCGGARVSVRRKAFTQGNTRLAYFDPQQTDCHVFYPRQTDFDTKYNCHVSIRTRRPVLSCRHDPGQAKPVYRQNLVQAHCEDRVRDGPASGEKGSKGRS